MSNLVVNPFPYAPLWTPEEIDTEAWYDADDASTITESGGAVSQIDDKSGNAQHLSQATSTEQPTTGTRTLNGLNVLDSDGNDYLERSTFSYPASGDLLILMVAQVDADPANWAGLVTGKKLAGGNMFQAAAGTGPGWDGDLWQSGLGSNATASGGPHDGPSVYGWFFDFSDTSKLGAFVDGVSSTTDGNYTTKLEASAGIFRWFRNQDDNTGINGLMAEMVVVEGATTEQRQLIEGYLAWKWGLQANLPASHPFKSNPPRIMRQAWTPTNLASGLMSWFDAADGDTITESGGFVSQWNDKSGNGYNVSQGTGANQPTTGSRTIGARNALGFDGSSDRLTRGSGAYARNVGSCLVIAVADVDSILNQRVLLEYYNNGTSTRLKHQVEASAWSGGGRRLDGDGYVELSSLLSCSTGQVIFGTLFDYASAQMNWTVDGTLGTPQAFQTAGNTSDTDSGGMGVGARPNGNESFDGAIGELIVIDDDSTTATRQLIEGYLAWKWGLQDNLPVGHPYKNERPWV